MRIERGSGRQHRWLILVIAMVLLIGCDQILPKRSPGEKLYRKHCAECHGVDGSGNTVRSMGDLHANLLDNDWRHAGDAAGIETVINQKLVFEHPSFGDLKGPEVKQIVDHVLELRGERRR